MTDETQPIEQPKPDRMAKARAAKAAKKKTAAPMIGATALILDLQRQISEMRAEKAAVVVNIPPAPEPSEENPPGSYREIKLGNGQILYQKIRWNRASVEERYPKVTFTPNERIDVLPHGILYALVPDVEVTVPSIVKTEYDRVKQQREKERAKYRPWRSADKDDLEDRVVDNPGTKQWSRVARLATLGIRVNPEVMEEEPTPSA